MQASGRQPEQDVARADVVSREELRAFDGADSKACEIVLPCGARVSKFE